MSLEVELLAGEPILIVTFEEPFSVQDDVPIMLAEIKRSREQEPRQMVVVIDMSRVELDFPDLVYGLGVSAQQIRKEKAAGARMPAKYVFVGSDALVQLAASAMAQDQYGGIGAQLFSSRDEAIAFSRSLIALPSEP
jgi:hypothetical protein